MFCAKRMHILQLSHTYTGESSNRERGSTNDLRPERWQECDLDTLVGLSAPAFWWNRRESMTMSLVVESTHGLAATLSLHLDETSDETLIAALAGGATWAMDLLYQRYSRVLYSLAYRVVNDRQTAEDLLQEVFL